VKLTRSAGWSGPPWLKALLVLHQIMTSRGAVLGAFDDPSSSRAIAPPAEAVPLKEQLFPSAAAHTACTVPRLFPDPNKNPGAHVGSGNVHEVWPGSHISIGGGNDIGRSPPAASVSRRLRNSSFVGLEPDVPSPSMTDRIHSRYRHTGCS
jgi:hypothetical protein